MTNVIVNRYGNKQDMLKISLFSDSMTAGVAFDSFNEGIYKLRLKKNGHPVAYINKRCGKMVIHCRKNGIGTDVEYKLTEDEYDRIADEINSLKPLPNIEKTEQEKRCFYR